MWKCISKLILVFLLASTAIPDVQARDKHLFLSNHPRLRRLVKAAGLGAVTGGLAGPILGKSAASGALLGAGEHAAVRGFKDHHDWKHRRKLDRHIW